jgi:hypothetical protein
LAQHDEIPTSSGSSSDATESENTCNDHNDYEKSTCLIGRRNSLPAASTVSCSSSEINLKHVHDHQFNPPVYDFVVNPDFLALRNDPITVHHCSRMKYDQNNDTIVSKSTKVQVPVLVSSMTGSRSKTNSKFDRFESYDELVNNTREEVNFDSSHEHYMIPTTNPKEKRSLSLFNPEFLPNFNDMLAYVSDTGANTSFSSTINQSFEQNSDLNSARDSRYTSLHMQDRFKHTTENFYASVVIPNTEQESNTIEYNC